MDLIEMYSKYFSYNINTIYFWTIISMIILFVSKLNISYDKLKEKILISYLFFLSLKFFNLVSTKFILGFSLILYFIFIELIYKDEGERILIRKVKYYILDFIYKIIFKYCYIGFLLSLFIISSFNITSVQNYLVNISNINYYLGILSLIVYLFTLNYVLSNRFKTISLWELKNKMNSIKEFNQFYHDYRLEDFSKMLLFYEDRSYFSRTNSFNLFSFSFIKYKFNRVRSNRKSILYSIVFIGGFLKDIVTCIVIVWKIIELFLKTLFRVIKSIFKFISKGDMISSIRSISRGYSTIEMQLIRTLALEDGYSCTIQRKFYEIIYSNLFFKSLKQYYMDYNYVNIDEYKYYLLYLYIVSAPTFINNKRYNNIFELFKERDNVLEITNEEFFIFCLGLANRKISSDLISDYWCPIEIDKDLLDTITSLTLYPPDNSLNDESGVNVLLINYYNNKKLPLKLYFYDDKNLKDLIEYVECAYCDEGKIAVINNFNNILYGPYLPSSIIKKINVDDYNTLLTTTIGTLKIYCDISNVRIEIIYNYPFGIGGTSAVEEGIKYRFHNNEKSTHHHVPHVHCSYGGEEIRINLLNCSIMDNKEFKSHSKTKSAKDYVKLHRNELLDFWDNVVDKDNDFCKKISSNFTFHE